MRGCRTSEPLRLDVELHEGGHAAPLPPLVAVGHDNGVGHGEGVRAGGVEWGAVRVVANDLLVGGAGALFL